MHPQQQMLLAPVKKKFQVTYSWSMCATDEIEAFTEEEAHEIAYDADIENGEYLDDSFHIDFIEEVQ